MKPLSEALAPLAASLAALKRTDDERKAKAVAAPPAEPWPEPQALRDDAFAFSVIESAEPWDGAKHKIIKATPFRVCPYCRDAGWSCTCNVVVDRAQAITRARIPGNRVDCNLRGFEWRRLDGVKRKGPDGVEREVIAAFESALEFAHVFTPLKAGQSGKSALAELASAGKRDGKPRREWDWGVMLYGPPGTGKSHLAAGFAREAGVRGYTSRFGFWPDLLRAYRAIQRPGCEVSEFDFIDALTRVNLVVLDEVRFDLGGKNDYKTALLASILDAAQSNGAKVVVTTNFTAAELRSHSGDHVVSRMSQMMPAVECKSKDAREDIAAWG